jgi:sortase (surface protein transpeptidase)
MEVVAALAAVACGSASQQLAPTPGATAAATSAPSPPSSTTPASATALHGEATPARTVPAAPTPATSALASPTANPCVGHCPSGGTPEPPTPATVGDDGVPRVPPLKRLTFSPGETLTAADLHVRGVGQTGTGLFSGVSLVIPSIGVDANIETQVVTASGEMPEPSSYQIIAWYDFGVFPGAGGYPLTGGNVVMAANLGGVFASLSAVAPGEIVTLHLTEGRRLYYRVEFNKTIAIGSDWTDIVASTADESMTLITAAGTGSGSSYSHRRIVWARRANCTLLEAPETPTRAPYVECEEPV